MLRQPAMALHRARLPSERATKPHGPKQRLRLRQASAVGTGTSRLPPPKRCAAMKPRMNATRPFRNQSRSRSRRQQSQTFLQHRSGSHLLQVRRSICSHHLTRIRPKLHKRANLSLYLKLAARKRLSGHPHQAQTTRLPALGHPTWHEAPRPRPSLPKT